MTINDMLDSRKAYMQTLPALPIDIWDAVAAAYAAGWTAATKRCTEEMATLLVSAQEGTCSP